MTELRWLLRGASQKLMDGLLEWHITAATAGIPHEGPEAGGGGRMLRLADPDGNRVVLLGA